MRCIFKLPVLVFSMVLAGCSLSDSEETAAKPSGPNWLASRTWVSRDGRNLDGALSAQMKNEGVIRRASDGRLLRMPTSLLNDEGKAFMAQALGSGQLPRTLSDVWYLKTTLTIPGGEAYMPPEGAAGTGPRIAKAETSYWLLVMELDGSGAKWARVDFHVFNTMKSDSLVMRGDLTTQMRGGGSFLDEVSCPNTDCYVIDARYGLTSHRINVTRAMMGHVASGSLPITVDPGMFGMPNHSPDVWDLTITWQRTGQGSLNRVARDQSILAWP